MGAPPLSVTVNGREHAVHPDDAALPLVDWLRNKARVKSAKVGCGEGGCGACAVLVTRGDGDGSGVIPSTCSINSCLTPVFSILGSCITTAEGLPGAPSTDASNASKTVNPIAQRLASFHASQCGFCTPGMAVACQAAVERAAALGRKPTAVDMRDGLDGNLCRCTGWRPIIDACKSFACDVDVEDLGLITPPRGSNGQSVVENGTGFPPTIASTLRNGPGGQAPVAAATPGTPGITLGDTGMQVYTPHDLHSLTALLQELPSGDAVRLVAGNTGSGVYKDLWPRGAPGSGQDKQPVHVIVVNQVRELSGTTVAPPTAPNTRPELRLGAGVTLKELQDSCVRWADDTDGCPGPLRGTGAVWRAVAAHVGRVAGSHVRGAATLGGNLVLSRDRGLPSDIATLLLALGADVEVVRGPAFTSPTRVPLEEYLTQGSPASSEASAASGSGALQEVITAVLVPVPEAGSVFWSHRIASRYSNAKALMNAAALAPPPASPAAAESAQGAGEGPESAARPTFVLGLDLSCSPGHEEWRVGRCPEVEAALAALNPPGDAGPEPSPAGLALLLAHALPALSATLDRMGVQHDEVGAREKADDVANNGHSSPAAAVLHAQYLRSAAEGVLAHAVSALYGPVGTGHSLDNGSGSPAAPLLTTPILGRDTNGRCAPAGPEGEEASNGHPHPHPTGVNGTKHACGGCGGGVTATTADSGSAAWPGPLPAPAPCVGTQDLPAEDPSLAPLTQALPKESAVLQALGQAQYTDDAPVHTGALYAAYVTASVAKGTVQHVDTTDAMAVPGAVRFVGPQDIPAVNQRPTEEPVFGTDVEYHGQPIGLMLATSYHAARQAARAVRVQYSPPATPAVLTPEAARASGSFYPLRQGMMAVYPAGDPPGSVCVGAADVASKLAESPAVLRGQRVRLPSQAHMYMETQSAVAEVDEGGGVVVHSSTQSTDNVQLSVAAALGLKQAQVDVRCRRAGGGFGGKAANPGRIAAAAAVAAVVTGCQVRLAVDRNTDLSMIGGRCAVDVQWDVGYCPDTGRITALDMTCVLEAGAYPGLASMDVSGMISVVDNVYHLPALRATYQLLKLNIPPRTAVRGPGDFMGVLAVECVVDSVVAATGLDPAAVREVNMRQPPTDGSNLANSVGKPLGAPQLYTLPRIWKELKASTGYESRASAVAQHNAAHTWSKRGLALVPCAYPLPAFTRDALVHVYFDGSVRIAHPGVEIGQGAGIKVLQTAAYELSQALPEARRPLPLDLLRTADTSTFVLPHNSLTAASTTSDAACAAVRVACAELVARLKPFAASLGPDYTWPQLVAKTFMMPGFRGLACLSAVGTGTLADSLSAPAPGRFHAYTAHGAALAEVEVDVLTGERRVLSVDILFDCGRSLNPGVDLGQIEGAFVYGMGLTLNEHMEADPITGACTTGSTWSYKVPGATCVPQRLHVAMLKDSPAVFNGPLSAKAVGEPPLLLSSAVLMALCAATRAASHQVFGGAGTPLAVPATPQAVKLACGTPPLAHVLKGMARRAAADNGIAVGARQAPEVLCDGKAIAHGDTKQLIVEAV